MARRYIKYTKELLEPVIRSSYSWRQVLLYFGLRDTGGSRYNLIRRANEWEIDYSHFLGQGHMKGKRALKRKGAAAFLVLGKPEDAKTGVDKIRRSLDEIGRERICVKCRVGEEWCGERLVLQIDHINGFRWDNREENLRYLCPNCHSQTETFGSNNKNNKWACGETGNTQ